MENQNWAEFEEKEKIEKMTEFDKFLEEREAYADGIDAEIGRVI